MSWEIRSQPASFEGATLRMLKTAQLYTCQNQYIPGSMPSILLSLHPYSC